jgi:hypothetical protein
MMHPTSIPALRTKFEALLPMMDERLRRRWAAADALALGYGGISAVAAATGLARNTIAAGIAELGQRTNDSEPTPTIRRPGAGRKSLTSLDPELLHALDRLIDPATRGDPDSPLRWTCTSTTKLAEELTRQNHPISDRSVAHLLRQAGYSRQANRKTREGGSHPDRNAQFEYLNNHVRRRQQRGQPVISVDTKKKELVGDFKNGGREWQPSGQPEEVRVHDFQDKKLGKAIPYGVYDVTHDQGWVSVGITHDTAYFATATIRRWWQKMGAVRFAAATGMLITADGGGSNGVRTRLWKVALQELADEMAMPLSVCHFPPGTSKWNKIEHRLFCYITQNWRGRPLVSREAIVNLIGATRTESGLCVEAELDTSDYPTGIKVTDEELAAVKRKRAKFHGEWNYTISPRK